MREKKYPSFVDTIRILRPPEMITQAAVVRANNDIENQGIIQRAQKCGWESERTVGIITKPDLINRGTEGRIARLAKSKDTTKLSRETSCTSSPICSSFAIAIAPKNPKR